MCWFNKNLFSDKIFKYIQFSRLRSLRGHAVALEKRYTKQNNETEYTEKNVQNNKNT